MSLAQLLRLDRAVRGTQTRQSLGGQPVAARDVFGIICASSALAILAVNRFSPPFLNADTLLYSIISLQNATLFYWGQNRLVNFLPWALSWITNPHANLAAHLFLFSFSFFALLCVLALVGTAILFPDASRRDRWTATILLLTVTLAVLQPYAAHTFISEGQPYAASYLLTILAALLLARPIHAARALTAAACLFIATGLNPSVLLPVLVLSGFMVALVGWRGAVTLAVITIAGVAVWAALSHWAPAYPVAYTGLDVKNLNTAMAASVARMALALRLSVVAVLCALLAVLASLPLHRASNRLVQLTLASLVIFALAWSIGFSANTWVKANGSAFRYFFPVVIIIPITITLQLFCYLLPLPQRLKDYCAAACIGLVAVYLVRAPVAFADYAVFGRVASFADYARLKGVQFVTGDYWAAWPTVFRLLDQPSGAFGLTARANGNVVKMREALEVEITTTGNAKALCLGDDQPKCLQDAEFFTSRRWSATADICPG